MYCDPMIHSVRYMRESLPKQIRTGILKLWLQLQAGTVLCIIYTTSTSLLFCVMFTGEQCFVGEPDPCGNITCVTLKPRPEARPCFVYRLFSLIIKKGQMLGNFKSSEEKKHNLQTIREPETAAKILFFSLICNLFCFLSVMTRKSI